MEAVIYSHSENARNKNGGRMNERLPILRLRFTSPIVRRRKLPRLGLSHRETTAAQSRFVLRNGREESVKGADKNE